MNRQKIATIYNPKYELAVGCRDMEFLRRYIWEMALEGHRIILGDLVPWKQYVYKEYQ